MVVNGRCNRHASKLISSNAWKPRLQYIPTQIQTAMHKLIIHNHIEHDFWHQIPNKLGQFSMKLAWEQIRCKQTEFNWTKFIQDKIMLQKCLFVNFWQKLRNLNTKDRLSKWNTTIDRMCALCLNQVEDKDLLFFNCNYSRHLLEETMHKLSINLDNNFDINHVLEIIYQNQKSNSLINHIISIAFTSLVWNVWCERNNRVFKNIEMPTNIRIGLLIQDCRYLIKHSLNLKLISTESKLILDDFDIATDPRSNPRPP